MNMHILEKLQIVGGFVPVNLASAANAGDWVSLKGYHRCAIVFFAGAGTNGQDPTLTLEQAKAVDGSGPAKALTFTRIDTKQGTLTAVAQFTTITQAAAATYTHADAAENQKIWVVDILAEDLDIDNGYDCIRASINDVGTNSQIGGMLYLLHDPKYNETPLAGAITD